MRRVGLYIVLVPYLLLTAIAFVYTVFRIDFPHTLWRLAIPSYGMMAPYQGASEDNGEFIISGKIGDGAWEEIDIAYFYPMNNGEKIIRLYMRVYNDDAELLQKKYQSLLTQLRDHKKEEGTTYDHLKIEMQRWPQSNDGYYALKRDPLITYTVLAEI